MSEIYEISILGRIVWDLHSLNNEGTVGNVTEPRTVVLADGTKTDGISGEMLKHIHVAKMWESENDKNKFCVPCRILEPARADKSKNVTEKSTPQDAVQQALKECKICDTHGFLVQKPTVARPSTIEFGWAVGVPEVYRDIHVHARHALGEKGKVTNKEETEKTSQMVYHRPTRSGIYAIVSLFQPWRIGLNNVNFQYEIDEEERISRYQLALKAYQSMFLRTDGAMTTTRMPHTESFEGIIMVSRTNFPAPVISPLNNNYKTEIKNIQAETNSIDIKEFLSVSEFVSKINELMDERIYTLQGGR